ncbi:MAG: hypothetical protein JSR37_04525 [Verrucomicrobia bacterium]|nr:hypothetical protein [Verrucomicrobiota bacterium]MBS0637076.1 hypothetical protein [Verrucomicrobiota bacterium]
MKRAWRIVAGIFFGLIAVTLFTGLYLNYPILGINSPTYFWPNFIGFLATSLISIWMFSKSIRS